ncbi:hypothetical protein GCM10027615_76170 [Plantactinospora veratri]
MRVRGVRLGVVSALVPVGSTLLIRNADGNITAYLVGGAPLLLIRAAQARVARAGESRARSK